jgi:hypothetical protein
MQLRRILTRKCKLKKHRYDTITKPYLYQTTAVTHCVAKDWPLPEG